MNPEDVPEEVLVPVVWTDEGVMELRLAEDEQGRLALPVFSTLDLLLAAFGEHAHWAAVTPEMLEADLQAFPELAEVWLDPVGLEVVTDA